MERRDTLLSILADGKCHSGEFLAEELGISRTAVWKHVQCMAEWGLDIFAVRGRGYRLVPPIRLLDRHTILSTLEPKVRTLVRKLDLFSIVESTNAYLMAAARLHSETGHVCLAEHQTRGRGRRGRDWVSPFGRNLYLSVLWRFEQAPSLLPGLGLAIGVAVAEALNAAGGAQVGLKWPNDLYWRDRKLGGILLEMFGEAGGPSTVVVGIGVNVDMTSQAAPFTIDQPWTDFATAASNPTPCRNTLAAYVLNEVLVALETFARAGLSPFVERWNKLDVLRGRDVDVHLSDGSISGRVNGIDDDGALLVLSDGYIKRFVTGELSVRLAAS